ncbi:MAG TPA: hypothetical protein TECP_01374 [Hyphomicrobiaceae bacterium MAG_BT-2024]
MKFIVSTFLAVIIIVCLAGCATDAFIPIVPASTPTKYYSNEMISEHILTPDELALPCSKLRGRIQLRILEVRDRDEKQHPSTIASSMRRTADSSGVWHNMGSLSDVGSSNDISVLTAYNQRLTQLGCQNYNISVELDYTKSAIWQVQ